MNLQFKNGSVEICTELVHLKGKLWAMDLAFARRVAQKLERRLSQRKNKPKLSLSGHRPAIFGPDYQTKVSAKTKAQIREVITHSTYTPFTSG